MKTKLNKKNKTNIRKSKVVLVYDRYFNKRPSAALLIFEKILLCCGITVCSMMFVLSEYDLPIDLRLAAAWCAGFSVLFPLIFVFVRKSIALPVIVLSCGALIWWRFEPFRAKISYFADAMLLQADGRLFHTRELLINDVYLNGEGSGWSSAYIEGAAFGTVILCAVFALITAASLFGKPNVLPPLAAFLLLWAPRMAAENLRFNFWLIPAAALYAGTAALSVSYRRGLVTRGEFAASYREKNAREERAFLRETAKASYPKRVAARGAYYSKYFSVAICAAVMFTASAVAASAALGDSRGIDYTDFYSFLNSLGTQSGISSPFRSGPASEYFTDAFRGINRPNNGLSVISPGRGEQEIIRVSNDGTLPVYLRGDIGIDFTGSSWSSPTSAMPESWKSGGLSESYRPVEIRAARNSQFYTGDFMESESVKVEYLSPTAVVFLPAYTSNHAFYDNESYSVSGDYVVRSKNEKDRSSMMFTAYTPLYTNTNESTLEDEYGVRNDREIFAVYSACADRESFFTAADELCGAGVIEDYAEFAEGCYIGVPNNLKSALQNYLDGSGLSSAAKEFAESGEDVPTVRYETARAVAEFLRENYTYSLDAPNNPVNPIMSFLNTTKSGHCALYASSMTLLLRQLGIPARYCTGFVAQPSGGIPQTLRTKNLHAWCEVYLGEIGWAVFDPTSASLTDRGYESDSSEDSGAPSETSRVPDSSTADSSETHAPESSEHTTDIPLVSDSSDVSENTNGKINVIPYLLGILAVFAAAAAAFLTVRGAKRFERRVGERLKEMYSEKNSEKVYLKLLAVMRLCGLSPNSGEMPREFCARADKALAGCGISDCRDLLERLTFGGKELDASERAQLGRLLEKAFAAADKRLKPFGRLRLRRLILEPV